MPELEGNLKKVLYYQRFVGINKFANRSIWKT